MLGPMLLIVVGLLFLLRNLYPFFGFEKMWPVILIVIGVLFLMNNMFPGVFRFGKMWPVILIVIGLAKIFEYLQGHGPAERTEDRKEGQ